MTLRSDVRFVIDDGIELGAWLYLPKRDGQRCPAITMAHGYACVKEHSIVRYDHAHRSGPGILSESARAHEVVLIPGGHFAPYSSGFQNSCAAAIDWFRQHLDRWISVPLEDR